MIQFRHVDKAYENGVMALNRVSFRLAKSEIAFITGHSGAGKSTLLKLICGIEKPSSGQIIINRTNMTNIPRSNLPYIRRRMGIIFQDPHLLYDRSVFDNVALPLIIESYSFKDINRRVQATLDKVGLLEKRHLHPQLLSSGEQQRVGIARAIVNKPIILLADEPTGNLDPGLSTEIMQLFEYLNEYGVSCLIASHDLALLQKFKHRLLVLNDGRLVCGEKHASQSLHEDRDIA